MSWIRTILDELIGLFVDDGNFALAIVVWIAIVAALARFAPATQGWDGIVLFAGLAAILAESTLRRARK